MLTHKVGAVQDKQERRPAAAATESDVTGKGKTRRPRAPIPTQTRAFIVPNGSGKGFVAFGLLVTSQAATGPLVRKPTFSPNTPPRTDTPFYISPSAFTSLSALLSYLIYSNSLQFRRARWKCSSGIISPPRGLAWRTPSFQ